MVVQRGAAALHQEEVCDTSGDFLENSKCPPECLQLRGIYYGCHVLLVVSPSLKLDETRDQYRLPDYCKKILHMLQDGPVIISADIIKNIVRCFCAYFVV